MLILENIPERTKSRKDKIEMIRNFQKWKWKSLSRVRLYSPRVVHGIPARILEWVASPFSRDFPYAGIKLKSPALWVDSLTAELPGNPSNLTKVRSYYIHTHTHSHTHTHTYITNTGGWDSLVGSLVLGRSPGEGKVYPLQHSGQEKSTDCIIPWVAKSRTQLSDFHFHFQTVNESACDARVRGSVPRSGWFPGEGSGNSLQYSCLEKSHGQRSLTGYSAWGT